MPAWAKIVLRSVGTLNAVLAVLGFYWLVFFVHNVLARARPDPYAPYFGISFAVMTAINIAFLALFLTAAFRLFRLKNSGIIMHSISITHCLRHSQRDPLACRSWSRKEHRGCHRCGEHGHCSLCGVVRRVIRVPDSVHHSAADYATEDSTFALRSGSCWCSLTDLPSLYGTVSAIRRFH